jgi:hypothetical protein
LGAGTRLLKQASSTRSRRPSRWKDKEFAEQVYAGTTILFFTVGNAIKAVPWVRFALTYPNEQFARLQ